jgi:hypothetical protein
MGFEHCGAHFFDLGGPSRYSGNGITGTMNDDDEARVNQRLLGRMNTPTHLSERAVTVPYTGCRVCRVNVHTSHDGWLVLMLIARVWLTRLSGHGCYATEQAPQRSIWTMVAVRQA